MNVAWYVARTGGILGFTLLTASAVLGLTLAGRPRLARWPRFAIEDVHRFAGMLAGVFIWLHVLVFLLDNYLNFGLKDLVVPGAAPYRPVWTAFGVVAAELLLAIAITNRYRKRLPYVFWRRAHMLNFLVWSLALVHGITAGSDSDTTWARLLYVCCASAVAAASAWRILVSTDRTTGSAPAAAPVPVTPPAPASPRSKPKPEPLWLSSRNAAASSGSSDPARRSPSESVSP
jgi:sulfoxide reductase heme-binding subunit YedZ